MSDIFISYSHDDKDEARRIVSILREYHYTVFWDENIRIGEYFDKRIEEKILKSRLTIVIWSENSVESDWVRSEANFANGIGKYFPVAIGDPKIPLPFNQVNTFFLATHGTHALIASVKSALKETGGENNGDWRFYGGFNKNDPLLNRLAPEKNSEATRYELCRDVMTEEMGIDNETFRKKAEEQLKIFTSEKPSSTPLNQKDAETALYLAHGLIAAYDKHGKSINPQKSKPLNFSTAQKMTVFRRVYLNTVNCFLKDILKIIKSTDKQTKYGLKYKERDVAEAISWLIKSPAEIRGKMVPDEFAGKIHAAYVGGRISRDHSAIIEKSLDNLKKRVEDDINNLKPQEDNLPRQRMLRLMRRTVLLSKSFRGDEAAKRSYMDLIQNSWIETDVNAGFHLEYYGDQPRDDTAPLCSRDEGGTCSNTIEYLASSIDAQFSASTHAPLLSVEIYTLASVIGRRLRGKHRDQATSGLHLIEQAIKKVDDQDLRIFLELLLDAANSDHFFAARELGKYFSAKNAPRNGWIRRGVMFPESVGAHTLSTIWLSNLLNNVEKNYYSVERIKKMLEIHDIAEGITSDIVQSKRNAETERREKRLMRRLSWLGLYTEPRTDFFEYYALYDEFVKESTTEAKIAKDLDRLDIVLQGQSILATDAAKKCNREEIENMIANVKAQIATGEAKEIMGTIENMNVLSRDAFGEAETSEIGRYFFDKAIKN